MGGSNSAMIEMYNYDVILRGECNFEPPELLRVPKIKTSHKFPGTCFIATFLLEASKFQSFIKILNNLL